ncbi:MAG: type II toxin-antitoxin system RelE/ParE family toxin [Chitinophagaceae bacterium]
MSFTYELHPLIRQDFDEGYSWYEEKQKGLGERFLKAVKEKIDEIVEHPEVYGHRGNKIYREAKVDDFPYAIIYKLDKRKRKIYINAAHHMSKHPRKKFRK